MTKLILVLASAAAVAACSGKVETESGGALDTTRDTTANFRVPDIDVGLKRDTLTLPTFEKRGDTIIMGRKPVQVKRPTVDVNKQP